MKREISFDEWYNKRNGFKNMEAELLRLRVQAHVCYIKKNPAYKLSKPLSELWAAVGVDYKEMFRIP